MSIHNDTTCNTIIVLVSYALKWAIMTLIRYTDKFVTTTKSAETKGVSVTNVYCMLYMLFVFSQILYR